MRKKKIRFAENALATNLIEEGKANYQTIKDGWPDYFGNSQRLVLELGCGKGSYTIGLAERYPDTNFIGVDVKGDRLWHGSKQAAAQGLKNVAFLRSDIVFIRHFFQEGIVSEIYLTFPDPFPRERDAKRRLTSPRFLALYENILIPKGKVHLKTDNQTLFSYALATLNTPPFHVERHEEDLHKNLPPEDIHRQIQTDYEKRFRAEGVKIKYLQAGLSKAAPQSHS